MFFGLFKKKKIDEAKLEEIGEVSHYFPHVKAAVVKIKCGSIGLKDKVLIRGQTTNFTQSITSLQLNHRVIQRAAKGKEIGLKVKERVRQGDKLYKINQ